MNDPLTALTLMKRSYPQIQAGATLRDALALLLDAPEMASQAPLLVVQDEEGRYLGAVTAREFLHALRAGGGPENPLDQPLAPLADAAHPAVQGGDRLLLLMNKISETRAEALVVLEDGKALGLVTAADVFRAAAGLALTPETSGIALGDTRVT